MVWLWMAILLNNARRLRRKIFSRRGTSVTTVLACVFFIGFLYIVTKPDPQPVIDQPVFTTSVDDPTINWATVAHVQYVLSPDELCKAVMLFSELKEVASLALRVLLYPNSWSLKASNKAPGRDIARLLRYAVDEFSVILQPVEILREDSQGGAIWREPYTRFLAYNLTQYDRVITLGLNNTLLNAMDDLFFLPPTPLAMPYVYWSEPKGWALSDQIMVIQPSTEEFAHVEQLVKSARHNQTEVDIVDLLYGEKLTPLPQRPYHMLTEEYRRNDWEHKKYLGKDIWDAQKILRETRLVHFFDPKLPKEWAMYNTTLARHAPRCQATTARRPDCRNRSMWYKLHRDYTYRRRNICGKGFELSTKDIPPKE